MAASPDSVSMALFCDFENVALGVRDAKYEKFDIKLVLERLLLKGSIVVKKAYCDWERYKGFKAGMHEANFELIEIPHVRQSGKNSADIRLVVDALDLCYTKSHVDTFVIISGDSDFSPLVSKLRENAKQVIGVGVKQSTSDLLIANCDEFIFYDDLVRETRHAAARREPREAQQAPRRSPEEEKRRKEETDARRSRAVDIVAETFDALLAERGDTGKIWASVLKEAIKRRKPDFSETRYGFKAFGNLLEEAQARGLLEVGRDEKSGTWVTRSQSAGLVSSRSEAILLASDSAEAPAGSEGFQLQPAEPRRPSRRSGRGPRKGQAELPIDELQLQADDSSEAIETRILDEVAESLESAKASARETGRKGRGRRKPAEPVIESSAEPVPAAAPVVDAPPPAIATQPESPAAADVDSKAETTAKPRKRSPRKKAEAVQEAAPASLEPPAAPAENVETRRKKPSRTPRSRKTGEA
ncbi:NYN domain-containing protein [Zoogloea dura]|uniref:NYN domain-containing protein n=1 Tax=Zoogloea dura TaxID=2728840 RepID=A0A848G234_9RHOO|nr:NYN domain-containing protein [Zoogloea dura]NML25219.1 NYN domain-containing protein [Zoogloea dura]